MFDFLNRNALPKTSPEDIGAAQTIIDAGKRVRQTFGIEVDTTSLERALVSAEATPKLVAALSDRELPILDTEMVSQYKQKRVRYTKGERFLSGIGNLLETFKEFTYQSPGWTLLLAICTVTFGIPFWIDVLWYDIWYLPSILMMMLGQFLLLVALAPVASENEKAFEFLMDFLYTCLSIIILSPIVLIGGLTLPWFMTDVSKRSWKTVSVKDFLDDEVSDAFSKPIALLAIASEVVPAETIQFDVLHDEEGKPTDEAFLVVDVPGLEQEKLYLWHGK